MPDVHADFYTFQATLQRHYEVLTADPLHAWRYSMTPPAALAARMAAALLEGAANKDGEGIKRTCKELGIKYTYKAIEAYLKGH